LGFSSGILNASRLLTVRGVFNWTGGTIAGAVTIVANGTMNMSGGNNHDCRTARSPTTGRWRGAAGQIRGRRNPGTQIFNSNLWTVQTDTDMTRTSAVSG